MVASVQWRSVGPVNAPFACDGTPGSILRVTPVPDVAPDGSGGATRGELRTAPPLAVFHRHPPATGRRGEFSRRAFLRGAAACPALHVTLSLATLLADLSAASGAALVGERWDDRTLWDDDTGWV